MHMNPKYFSALDAQTHTQSVQIDANTRPPHLSAPLGWTLPPQHEQHEAAHHSRVIHTPTLIDFVHVATSNVEFYYYY